MQIRLWIYFIVWISLTFQAEALKCWKCIAHDCENDPEDNYKASKVTCRAGQECMKVRYRMFDNTTHYDSVIRTCSAGPCKPQGEDLFESCLGNSERYTRIGGCVLRACCSDKELCNSANGPNGTPSLVLKCFLFTSLVGLLRRCSV